MNKKGLKLRIALHRLPAATIVFMAALLMTTSCEDIPECPTQMCIYAGGWQLTEVFVDGVKDDSDFSQYRLTLYEPNPTSAPTSSFDRIQVSGTTDNGTWSLENGDDILRLVPDNDPDFTEDYVIESFTLRKLVLVLNRESTKTGPEQIKFVLEPF